MPTETAATLLKASGPVYVERGGTRLSLAEGDIIRATDTILTDSRSTAEIRFEDGTTATLSPGTALQVSDFAYGDGQEPSFVLNLAQGTMRSISGEVVKQNPDAFKIVTPKATVGIRGTELFNAVEGDREVHAVLFVDKGHVVVVTGLGGESFTLTAALQGVALDGKGVMVRQAYTVPELESLIRELAPSQLETPLPKLQEEAGGPEEEASKATDAPLTVIIMYEAPEVGTVAEGSGSSTLISALNDLAGTLEDAGFNVESMRVDTAQGLLASVELPRILPAVLPSLLPDGPGGLSTPEVGGSSPGENSGNEEPPSILDFVFSGDLPAGWGYGHLADLAPERPLAVLVQGNVNEDVPLNAESLLRGATAGDVIEVQGGLQNAALMGDAEFLGFMGRMPATDIVTGNDTITVGTVDAASAIYGDARDIQGSATITLGNDSITVGTLAGVVSGDVASPGGLGDLTFGNDTISVGTLASGGAIYGDAPVSGGVADGGHDSIRIETMQGGTVAGGIGSDTIAITRMETGSVDGEAGADVISVGTLLSGTVSAGEHDAVSVGTMSGGQLYGNMSSIAINSMQGGILNTDSASGGSTLTIATLQGGTLFCDMQDTLTISGLMSGGTVNGAHTASVLQMTAGEISGSANADTLSVTGTMSGGSISGGGGADSIVISRVDGTVTVDLGTDASADTFTNTNFSSGTINLNNFNTADSATFQGGSDIICAQRAGTFSLVYSDGRVVNITGDVLQGTASQTWTGIGGSSLTLSSGDVRDVLVGQAMTATEFGSWNPATYDTSPGGGGLVVNGDITSGFMTMDVNAFAPSLINSRLTVLGNVSADISGDLGVLPGNYGDIIFGNDTISIHGVMSGGNLYGDAKDLTGVVGGASASFGNDYIHIDTLAGGYIYGDANNLPDGTIAGGADTIDINHLTDGAYILCGKGADVVTIHNLHEINGTLNINLGSGSDVDKITLGNKVGTGIATISITSFRSEDIIDLGLDNATSGTYSKPGSYFILSYDNGMRVHIDWGPTGDADTIFASLTAAGNLLNYGALSGA